MADESCQAAGYIHRWLSHRSPRESVVTEILGNLGVNPFMRLGSYMDFLEHLCFPQGF